MGLYRIAQNGRVYQLKHGAISATQTAGTHNPPSVLSIGTYHSYPITFNTIIPPCMIQRNMVYYSLSIGEKGKRGANTYPKDSKGAKKMSEEIKTNNAVLRTGVIITGVYMGLALVGACYLMSIM